MRRTRTRARRRGPRRPATESDTTHDIGGSRKRQPASALPQRTAERARPLRPGLVSQPQCTVWVSPRPLLFGTPGACPCGGAAPTARRRRAHGAPS